MRDAEEVVKGSTGPTSGWRSNYAEVNAREKAYGRVLIESVTSAGQASSTRNPQGNRGAGGAARRRGLRPAHATPG